MVFNRFGYWLRLYKGSTSNKKRIFFWHFQGIEAINHGVTLRLRNETCIGIQFRKERK